MDLSLKNSEINFNSGSAPPVIYEFGDFQLQVEPRLLLKNGEELPLTPKAVATLCVLAARSEQVVSKDELMQKVWPDTVVEESNLAQYLHILRKTLGQMSDGRPYIETLKRRGYRFNAAVRSNSNLNGNGNSHRAEIDARIFDSEAAPVKRSFVGPLVIGTLVIVACVFSVSYFGKNSALVAEGERSKPAAEAIIMPLTSGENVTQTTISHDGKYFVYSDYDGDQSRLILQAVDRSSKSEILPRMEGRVENLSFTPNDAEIYFVVSGASAEGNGLFRISVNGGPPARVMQTFTSPVSFSEDGAKMVFVRVDPNDGGRQQILESSADGSSEKVLFDEGDDQRLSLNASLSHDGKFVVFGSITRKFPIVCSLVKLDINDGSVSPLTNEEWDSCYRTAFTHDDTGIAFVGTRHNEAFTTRRDQVYFLEIGQSASRRLTGDGNWHDPMSLGVTDSGEIIALPLNRISQIWTMDKDGSLGSAKQITQGQADGRSGIVPTPDGKVSFLARDGDGLALFEVDSEGQNRRRIVGSATMQELRGPPDGRFLVYAEQQNDRTQLFRVDRNGSDRRQLTFGDSSKIDSTISPDGKWIVYNDAASDGSKSIFSLRRIPADGGPPETLWNDYCGVPHYSHYGRFISCSSDDKLRILSTDTGIVIGELSPEAFFISNSGARWSPDDKYLVYRVFKNGATNLWRQSVQGGHPQQFTKFPKGELYNFSYGSDGKKLYLSRGTQIRNAILIRRF